VKRVIRSSALFKKSDPLFRSFQKERIALSLFWKRAEERKRAERSFLLFFAEKVRIARNRKERMPNPAGQLALYENTLTNYAPPPRLLTH